MTDIYHQNPRQMAQRLAEASGRRVSQAVRAQLLAGGVISQVGWLLFGFGLIFVWGFLAQAESPLGSGLDSDPATARGQVVRIQETRASENDTRIWAVHYRFRDEKDRAHEGLSYASGTRLQPGSEVTVEYNADDPKTSRIEGLRTAPFSAFMWFVAIFPLIGWGMVVAGLLRGRRHLRLLKTGRVAHGALVDKQPTNTRVNNQRVYKLTFEFQTPEGDTIRTVAKTHQPEHLEDESSEPLLYDPVKPWRACMLDAMPGRPRVGRDGRIVLGAPTRLIAVLILPSLTIVGHGAWLAWRLWN
jgi:hypothetical protein